MRGLPPFPPLPPFPWFFDCACCTFLRPSSLSSVFSFQAPAILVRGGIGFLPAAFDERGGLAGYSGSNCGAGAGNGPGVSCARTNPGAASAHAPNKNIKPTFVPVPLFIIILVAHII